MLDYKLEADMIFDGSVELDESYFGGHCKGKRGRGAAGKVAVCWKKMLMENPLKCLNGNLGDLGDFGEFCKGLKLLRHLSQGSWRYLV